GRAFRRHRRRRGATATRLTIPTACCTIRRVTASPPRRPGERPMRHRTPGFVLATTLLVLGACAKTEIRSRETLLTETLRSYAATVRWGDMQQAQAFIEPTQLAKNPPSAIELARFRQVQVSGYEAQTPIPVSEVEVRQSVQIELVN